MQAQSQIGAADDPRIVLGFEPPCAQLNPARGQAGEPPFELRPPLAIAGDQDDQIRKPALSAGGLPPANAMLERNHRIDDDVEIFVFRPARRANDEADSLAMHAEPSEERLPAP